MAAQCGDDFVYVTGSGMSVDALTSSERSEFDMLRAMVGQLRLGLDSSGDDVESGIFGMTVLSSSRLCSR